MKTTISIVVGILCFFGMFHVTGGLINYATSGMDEPYNNIFKIVLWILSFGITTILAFLAGIFGGGLIHAIIEDHEYWRKAKRTGHRKH